MKQKSTLKKVLSWLSDAGAKALVILLIVTAGFYAYAQVSWPADPNPVTGVVGMFVGDSVDATRADNQGYFNSSIGYNTANSYCETHTDSNITGSHVCTPDEMINSYNHGTAGDEIYTYGASAMLWINNGPPGFTASSNDCKGWKVTANTDPNDPNFGTVWLFNNEAGGLTPCGTGRAYACCK